MTHKPTQSPAKPEYDNVYAQEEQQWKDDQPTTQANQKKRPRKWNPKFARYPMPFQKMQKRDNYRYKRDADRNMYILNDLDEIEFLSSDKDYHVVNAHVKKYW
ncbi:hypothetical protein O3G_MSEX001122 [Manduca sexta]|nr:hypothetical protein O3G_MSEX001122 [Manduca sexta]